MKCHVFTPRLFWVAGVALLATAFLFSSVLPTSVLTFKKESGPGYWVPHQWGCSHVDFPCVTAWHTFLVTSCLCWCQLAVSSGWARRSVKFFVCHRAPSSQHAPGLGFTAVRALTLTSLRACAQTQMKYCWDQGCPSSLQRHILKCSLIAAYWSTKCTTDVVPDNHKI